MTAPQPSKSVPVVVVAEDEMLIRMAVVEALIEEGFKVIEAGHAADALATLHIQAADIHLLFTDIQMPGAAMDGLALAHHVRKYWPWIALLIASGYPSPDATLPAGSRFLAKPYAMSRVLTHVRELLAA